MNNEPYQQRAMADIAFAEQALRHTAEGTARDLQRVLVDLAFRFAGGRMEALRREHPGAPDHWNGAQWSQFWSSLQPEPQAPGWGAGAGQNSRDPLEKIAALEESNRKLNLLLGQEHQALLAEQEKAQAALRMSDELQSRLKKLEAQMNTAIVRSDATLPPFYQRLVSELSSLGEITVPARFEEQMTVRESPLRARRKLKILYLLARHGLSNRVEIERIVGEAEGIGPRSNSIKALADEMAKMKLLRIDNLNIGKPFQTSLALLEMTQDAIDLCQLLNWEVGKSEWTLVRGNLRLGRDQPHALLSMAIAMHARLRGWTVQILVDPQEPAGVALRVERDGLVLSVLVAHRIADLDEKIARAFLASNVAILVCTPDEEERKILVNECKRLGLPCCATDLHSLIFDGAEPRNLASIREGEELWIEKW
jgi:hypothetical protein